MSSYPSSTLKQARAFMEEKDKFGRVPSDVTPYFSMSGSGDRDVDTALIGLEQDLGHLDERGLTQGDYDAAAREIVHRNLAALSDEILTDADFWRYLSAVKFNEFVAHRHPQTRKSQRGEGIDGNWANFGAKSSSVVESLFFRLFTGADLAFESANSRDPYVLSRVADVDLWQSHIVRVLSGDNPVYVRELVKWFRDRDAWYENVTSFNVQDLFAVYNDNPRTRHLRDLVKRVRRLRSNVIHEYLLNDEVRQIVEDAALASLAEIRSWGRVRRANAKS